VATRGETRGQARVKVTETAKAIRAAMPTLDPTEQRIASAIHRLMSDGVSATSEAISQASFTTVDQVDQSLASWPGVYRDDEGRVVGFWGHAVAPLDPEYRLKANDRTTYAWCALDTLFIPSLVGETMSVEATDPVSGEPVSLVVDRDGARDVSPAGAVVSMVVPDGPFGYDVIETFCHRVLFFASEESGRRWVAEHEGTTLLSIDQAFDLGREVAVRIAPDLFSVRN
jgi:alkylmercury lyase